MYNNNFMLDRLTKQKEEIENLIKSYQTQPMNVFNVGNNQIEFEARFIGKEEKPEEIMVQRKTAFICLDNELLTIKEVNGDIKEYEIVIPKTQEQIENEQLKKEVEDLKNKLKERKKVNEYKSNTTNNKK